MKLSFHLATFEFMVHDTTILVMWEKIHGKVHLVTCKEEGEESGTSWKVEAQPNKTNSGRFARMFAKTIFQ